MAKGQNRRGGKETHLTYATMTTSSAKHAPRWYAALSPAAHALAVMAGAAAAGLAAGSRWARSTLCLLIAFSMAPSSPSFLPRFLPAKLFGESQTRRDAGCGCGNISRERKEGS
jgi:hypothetical protein